MKTPSSVIPRRPRLPRSSSPMSMLLETFAGRPRPWRFSSISSGASRCWRARASRGRSRATPPSSASAFTLMRGSSCVSLGTTKWSWRSGSRSTSGARGSAWAWNRRISARRTVPPMPSRPTIQRFTPAASFGTWPASMRAAAVPWAAAQQPSLRRCRQGCCRRPSTQRSPHVPLRRRHCRPLAAKQHWRQAAAGAGALPGSQRLWPGGRRERGSTRRRAPSPSCRTGLSRWRPSRAASTARRARSSA
mmetsp:Transcript_112639/g.359825  ORF Transcript_112639/g.359825 Transcript_112639/m.359825 type:complete len:248 (+) Transcript_112639:151-894(+)